MTSTAFKNRHESADERYYTLTLKSRIHIQVTLRKLLRHYRLKAERGRRVIHVALDRSANIRNAFHERVLLRPDSGHIARKIRSMIENTIEDGAYHFQVVTESQALCLSRRQPPGCRECRKIP